jgi:tripartite-type tricarboxylate transporter receptor subunit TctC
MIATGLRAAVVAAGLLAASAVQAQTFPSKPIRMIVGIAAGSPTDVTMRAVAQELRGSLGQPLTIDNRPGGEMVVASELCARAAPDGYTYCVVSNTAVSTNPHLFSKLSYDPEKDFKPVTGLWYLITGLLANASLPVKSFAELQALALARPGSLNQGTLGAGGADFSRQWLNEHWKTNIVSVPYKGANLVMNALLSGEIDISMTSLSGLGGQLAAGKVKIWAVSSSKRLRQLPDVATFSELGLEGYPRTWWGLFAPGGTPDAMAARINSEFVRVFRESKFSQYLENQFLDTMVSSPAEFATFLKEDRERSGQRIRKYNIPRH